MAKEAYTISRATLDMVLAALGDHMFSGEYSEYNNADVIDAKGALEAEIAAQEGGGCDD